MRSLFSLAGALAGMMTAAAVLAQTPGTIYQPSSFQPSPQQTYYAQPSRAAQLWHPHTSNVGYAQSPQPMGSPYAEQLNANPYRQQLDGQGMPRSPYGGGVMEGGYLGTGFSGTACDSCDLHGCDPLRPQWFGYAGGLVMTKTETNESCLSYGTGDYGNHLMDITHAEMDWEGGYELRLGRHVGCQNWAWEGVYWSVRGLSEASVLGVDAVDQLRTPLDINFQGLTYNPTSGTDNITAFFSDVEVHRLRRSFDFYNVELNVFQDPSLYSSYNHCGGLNVGVVGGLRYFRFSDGFLFSANRNDTVFTGTEDEIHYGIDATNDLFGGQVGLLANYSWKGWNIYGGSKFGLYGNRISHRSQIFGAAGNAYIDNPLSPNNGQEFDVSARRNDVSFLGELDLGASYQITRRISVRGGYRAVAATGLALSTDQIPQNFEDLQVLAATHANSSVVLHGAYLGGEFVW